MDITISKLEIIALIDDQFEYEEGDMSLKQKNGAIKDLDLGDYEIWVEQDSVYIEFEFQKIIVHTPISIDNMGIIVGD